MADTINVKPSTASDAVKVATDEVGNVHYPVYKIAIGDDGEARLVDENDNPLPVMIVQDFRQDAFFQEQLSLQMETVRQLEILNKYMAFGFEVNLDEKIEG